MPSLLRYDEMSLSTLRDKCKDTKLDLSGDKATLVARLATLEIDTIVTELHQNFPRGKKHRELVRQLQVAVEARADQVYNVKKQYLKDEMQEIKTELINIKIKRDEEKKEGMKRYNKQISNTREKKKVVDANGEKQGLSQRFTHRQRGQGGKAVDTEMKASPRESPTEFRIVDLDEISQNTGYILADLALSQCQNGRGPSLNPWGMVCVRSRSPSLVMSTIPSLLSRMRKTAMEAFNTCNISLGRRC